MTTTDSNGQDLIAKLINKQTYDILKFITLYALPSIGTLYFTLALIWNFPDAQSVLGTILAIEAFLSVILGISKTSYKNDQSKYNGAINVLETDDRITFSLELSIDPEDLRQLEEARFKINNILTRAQAQRTQDQKFIADVSEIRE